MVNKYRNRLINVAYQLDALICDNEEITKLINEVVERDNDNALKEILQLLSIAIKSEEKKVLQLSRDFNDCLLKYYGFQKIQEIFKEKSDSGGIEEEEKSMAELLQQLDSLVGLEKVKSKVFDLISYQKIQFLRKESRLKTSKSTLHLAFTGNPGTGKTTVARIIGHIYKQLGLLTKGHFIEVSRTDLIAGYQGQTALKVKDVIGKAKGGVLFIDEAYSITENEHSDSYGKECVTELTKALEDYRDDLVVIVAGYTEPMDNFFNSNPGLKSRFNTFIEFDDYSDIELMEMLSNLFRTNDYELSDVVFSKISESLSEKLANRTRYFSNGRFIRNLYEDSIMNHARRVAQIDNPTLEDLKDIKEIDIEFFE